MEFRYRMSVWDCIGCGIRNVFQRLFFKSKVLRTTALILGGSAVLVTAVRMKESQNIGMVGILFLVGLFLAGFLFVLLIRIPDEIVQLYHKHGKNQRIVEIEDGSIFVTEDKTKRIFLCRNIMEFKRQGRMFLILVTGRMGVRTEIYLPARLIGGKQEQDAFWKYVNAQRKISGDKLVAEGEQKEIPENMPENVTESFGGIRQVWNLDKLTVAATECRWIIARYMIGRRMKDWLGQVGIRFLLYVSVFIALACFLGLSWIIGIGVTALVFGYVVIKVYQNERRVSMRVSRELLLQCGAELYEDTWELNFTEQGIERKMPLLENIWDWADVGYLMESDELFHFFTKKQRLMFYMEKELLGDWKKQKLFVQDCQAKGISYQVIHPVIIRDIKPSAGISTPPVLNVVQGTDKKSHQKVPDTQEGWRKFWAEKEKKNRGTDHLQVVITVLAVVGIFLLAIFLPEFKNPQNLGGFPVIMDAPTDGGGYVFHPESYENYVPFATQVEVLEGLGFTIPQETVNVITQSMEAQEQSRVWVEGYPYTTLLTSVGMPEWNYDTWEIEAYPKEAFWFDWEGFDMSTEYTNILNAVNAMADGDFTITDIKQDMTEVDWEQGTGKVYISFRINGDLYQYKLKMMNDWLDTKIIKHINDALETAGVEKRVYGMDDGGQGRILFCRDSEWAKQFYKATGIRLETK